MLGTVRLESALEKKKNQLARLEAMIAKYDASAMKAKPASKSGGSIKPKSAKPASKSKTAAKVKKEPKASSKSKAKAKPASKKPSASASAAALKAKALIVKQENARKKGLVGKWVKVTFEGKKGKRGYRGHVLSYDDKEDSHTVRWLDVDGDVVDDPNDSSDEEIDALDPDEYALLKPTESKKAQAEELKDKAKRKAALEKARKKAGTKKKR